MLLTEVVKLFLCLIIVFCGQNASVKRFGEEIRKAIFDSKIDTLKVCVPALSFMIQNNLLYISTANLDPITYQVRKFYGYNKSNQYNVNIEFVYS